MVVDAKVVLTMETSRHAGKKHETINISIIHLARVMQPDVTALCNRSMPIRTTPNTVTYQTT